MKRFYLLLSLILATATVMAERRLSVMDLIMGGVTATPTGQGYVDEKVYANDITIEPGGTAKVTVNYLYSQRNSYFNTRMLYLILPEGITPIAVEGDDDDDGVFSITESTQERTWLIHESSLEKNTKIEGTWFTITLEADASIKSGTYTAKMTNIQTVKEDKTYQYAAVDFDDITFSIKVTGDNPGVNDPDGVDTDISSLANTVYFESTDAFAGSEVELSLQMNNVVTATGFQCDLYLPEGVTVPKDSDDFFKVYLSTERTTASKTNIFDCAMQPDGALRILCSSTKSATFSGISGEVATITLQLDESLQEGELPILLRNIVISDKNSNTYKVDYVRRHLNVYTYVLGDVNNDRDVNVGDITGTANAILGNPPANFVSKAADVNVDGEVNVGDITGIANLILYGAVKPGAARAPRRVKTIDDGSNTISIGGASIERGGQQTISVNLKNAVNACGLQFDLYLPEGISISKDEDEFYIMELSGRTTPAKTNIFDCAQQADGAYRILLGSTRSSAFSGNEGEICTLTIEASTDAPLGDYEVQVKNIVVSETNSDTYTTELYTFNLKVKGGTDQKCEKPTICYENGKLTFQCATEDAVCQSTIEDTDIKSYTGNEVELCVTYSISVYATKEGYEDSDVATATLCWIDVDPQTEGLEEDAIAEVKAMPALVQTVGGQVIVSGIADGTDVAVYGVNGAKEGSAISTNGRASILTNLTPGTVALVKIGGKSVKIVVKL